MTAKIHFKRTARFLAATAVLASGASAMAASTWNFDSCVGTASNQQATNSGNFGNSWKCAGSSGSGFVTATAYGAADLTGSTGFQTAYLSPQIGSGFGVASRSETVGVGSPNHSMDNDPSGAVTPDMILLKFDNSVALNAITAGWSQNDADLTMMAYTGPGAPAILGKTAGTLGWSLVKSVGDIDSGGGYAATNTDTVYAGLNPASTSSSWWLISAYSSSFVGGSALDSLKDYVKLLSVAGNESPSITVPEPGSIAMIATALLGLCWTRRRGVTSVHS